MYKVTKDLIGKWMVYYAASGFCCFYGEIIDVSENGVISAKCGIDRRIRYFGGVDCLFETKEEAKQEYESWLPEEVYR